MLMMTQIFIFNKIKYRERSTLMYDMQPSVTVRTLDYF